MLNQLGQAMEFAQKAIEASPTDGYPHFLRGSLSLDNVSLL